MAGRLLLGGCPLQGHSTGCPLAAHVGSSALKHTCTSRRRAVLHRRPFSLTAAAVATRDDQSAVGGADPSTSYSNGAGSSEDLAYNMETASNDVLYKRFFELLDGSLTDIHEGDHVSGVILSYSKLRHRTLRIFRVGERGAYVELGRKAPAYCHSMEMTLAKGVKAHEIVSANSVRDFVVSDVFSNGDVLVSMLEVEVGVVWARLAQLQQEAVSVTAKGVSTNMNGLVVEVMGISGYLPKRFMDRNTPAEEFVGKEFQVKVLEAIEDTERLIVAQKMMLPGTDEQGNEFQVGDVVEGRVVSIQPYGAFINCGGLNDGLLHVSQISHDRVQNLEAIFSIGDTIKVMVLTHERSKGRINLSTKKLEPSPGDMLRNPQKVFEQAERMAEIFKEQVKQAQELQAQSTDASLDPLDFADN